MPLLILKRPDITSWDKLILIIRGAHIDNQNTIVESNLTTMFQLNEQAGEILYQLVLSTFKSEEERGTEIIQINGTDYKFPRPFWEALFNVLFRWSDAKSASEEDYSESWDEQMT